LAVIPDDLAQKEMIVNYFLAFLTGVLLLGITSFCTIAFLVLKKYAEKMAELLAVDHYKGMTTETK
jgi:hypothetical protein